MIWLFLFVVVLLFVLFMRLLAQGASLPLPSPRPAHLLRHAHTRENARRQLARGIIRAN